MSNMDKQSHESSKQSRHRAIDRYMDEGFSKKQIQQNKSLRNVTPDLIDDNDGTQIGVVTPLGAQSHFGKKQDGDNCDFDSDEKPSDIGFSVLPQMQKNMQANPMHIVDESEYRSVPRSNEHSPMIIRQVSLQDDLRFDNSLDPEEIAVEQRKKKSQQREKNSKKESLEQKQQIITVNIKENLTDWSSPVYIPKSNPGHNVIPFDKRNIVLKPSKPTVAEGKRSRTPVNDYSSVPEFSEAVGQGLFPRRKTSEKGKSPLAREDTQKSLLSGSGTVESSNTASKKSLRLSEKKVASQKRAGLFQ